MKTEKIIINGIPAILVGEKTESVYLFVHGQGGNKEEALNFAEIAVPNGFQVLGIDLPEHGDRIDEKTKLLPWNVIPELEMIYSYLKENWQHISIRANSIGAWFCMQAFVNEIVDKCLFVSPILDMEKLIADMMIWANVTEERLQKEKKIATDFGKTLSWKYLTYVRENPILSWKIKTMILYADNDNLTQKKTVDEFVEKHKSKLTIMENGEHWFHTKEQLEFLKKWEKENV